MYFLIGVFLILLSIYSLLRRLLSSNNNKNEVSEKSAKYFEYLNWCKKNNQHIYLKEDEFYKEIEYCNRYTLDEKNNILHDRFNFSKK